MSGNMAAAFADANRPTVALQNPLDIYGKAADVVNALNANKAFRARQAAGEAYQQATDPTTGLVDPARAQALIAANPQAALAAQPSATSGQALSQAQQSQGIQRNDAISQLLGPVLKLPDAQLHDGAVAATQRAMQMGITTQQEGMTLLARLPNDPAALRQQLEQVRMSLLPPDQQRAAIYGSPLTYTAPGGTLAGGMLDQQTGAVSVPPQAGAPQGMSPGERSSVSTITNPDGSQSTDTLEGHMAKGRVTPLGALAPGYKAAAASPEMVTALRGQEATPGGQTSVAGARGQMQVTPQFFKQYAQPGESFDSKRDVEAVANRGIAALEAKYPGDPQRVATAYFSGEGNVAPSGSQTPYVTDAKDANGTQTSAYVRGASARYQSLKGGGAAGGGTTVPATLRQSQEASVAQHSADSRDAVSYQDRVYPLQQAAAALQTAKTGEGSEALQSIASRIQTLTPDALKSVMPNIRTPEEITAYDEARKYLTMAQQNRPGADRSDAGLATAGASSPSVHISNAAARLLVQAQLSVERSKQAMLLEFNDTHPQGTEGAYNRWKTEQAPKIDPRAFITDGQTPTERKSYYDRLGDTEQKNYLESYKLAKKWKLLTTPNG